MDWMAFVLGFLLGGVVTLIGLILTAVKFNQK